MIRVLLAIGRGRKEKDLNSIIFPIHSSLQRLNRVVVNIIRGSMIDGSPVFVRYYRRLQMGFMNVYTSELRGEHV